MSKPATQFEPMQVTRALEELGIPKRDIHDGKNLLRFIDDQEKCRKFCEVLQGPSAVVRDDATFMQRYQARAERVIRAFNNMPIPSDLDINKETYKETTMAKAATKKKDPKAAPAEGKTKRAPKLVLIGEGEPSWYKKFARPGVIFRMAQLLHRVEGEPVFGETKNSKVTGATREELLADLTSSFPEKEPSSLKTTIESELSSLQGRLGKKIIRVDDEKRGKVYNFK